MDIILRALEPSDIPTLLEWENDPEIWSISETIEPVSLYKLEAYMRHTLNFDVYGLRQLRLMICKVNDSKSKSYEPIGTVDLFELNPIHRHGGIGLMIRKDYQRQGFGALALERFVDYLFNVLHLHSVYANISETNTASLQLFENQGFTKIADYKEFFYENNKYVSQFTYQLINNQSINK